MLHDARSIAAPSWGDRPLNSAGPPLRRGLLREGGVRPFTWIDGFRFQNLL
jgi:hypothetical protein